MSSAPIVVCPPKAGEIMNDIQLKTFFDKMVEEKSGTWKFIEAHFGERSDKPSDWNRQNTEIAGMLRETADFVEKLCKD